MDRNKTIKIMAFISFLSQRMTQFEHARQRRVENANRRQEIRQVGNCFTVRIFRESVETWIELNSWQFNSFKLRLGGNSSPKLSNFGFLAIQKLFHKHPSHTHPINGASTSSNPKTFLSLSRKRFASQYSFKTFELFCHNFLRHLSRHLTREEKRQTATFSNVSRMYFFRLN